MLPQNNPDRIRVVNDDHRLVANADLLLSATLAQHLGLQELVDHHLDLGGGTACALGCVVKAPSILRAFLRSFRWGATSANSTA